MKLTQEQIAYIEGFLNRMELTQIDLRNEVLDHMASTLEDHMGKGFSFEDGFAKVSEEWYPELQNHQSYWLGVIHSGPKLMIDKSVRIIKKVYLKSAISAGIVAVFFYSFMQVFPSDSYVMILKVGFGGLLLFGALLYIYCLVQTHIKQLKTTYSFLIKLNLIPYLISVLTINPFVSEGLFSFDNPNYIVLNLAYNSFVLGFGYQSFVLFNKHNTQLNKIRL